LVPDSTQTASCVEPNLHEIIETASSYQHSHASQIAHAESIVDHLAATATYERSAYATVAVWNGAVVPEVPAWFSTVVTGTEAEKSGLTWGTSMYKVNTSSAVVVTSSVGVVLVTTSSVSGNFSPTPSLLLSSSFSGDESPVKSVLTIETTKAAKVTSTLVVIATNSLATGADTATVTSNLKPETQSEEANVAAKQHAATAVRVVGGVAMVVLLLL
jgi:hypothetical protein